MNITLDELRKQISGHDVLEKIIKRTIADAIQREMSVLHRALLTPREVAKKFRLRESVVRCDAESGKLKVVERDPRNGGRTFLIDAIDAARVYGAT